jgi:hypothetical protein
VHIFFKKPGSHQKILDAILVTYSNWHHAADLPILVAAVRNVVAVVTCSHDWCTAGAKINFAGYSGSLVSVMQATGD